MDQSASHESHDGQVAVALQHRQEMHSKPWAPMRSIVLCLCAIITLVTVLPTRAMSQDNTLASGRGQDDALAHYVDDVTAAARALIELTPPAQRDNLVFPFNSSARTSGRDTSTTPAFCAVLAECAKSWGLTQCGMSNDQLVAMQKMLSLALSPGGYQILLAVLNHQRVIGEMEDVSDPKTVEHAIDEHPNAQADSIFEFQELAPVPLEEWYPAVGAAETTSSGETIVNWVWNPPPGLEERRTQFCNYALALFGEPGSDKWGLRFEGHHITVNLTFIRDPQTGRHTVHTTPLFFGAFPMIVPQDPFAADDLSHQWTWTRGQVMMFSAVYHMRQFWQAVPERLRNQAFISPDLFPQAAPLLLDTPPPGLIASFDPTVDTASIKAYPHVTIEAKVLTAKAVWHLKQAFFYFIGATNPSLSPAYLKRLDQELASGELTLSWAGGPIDDVGTHLYSYLAAGSLLLEFLQSNQYSVQHDPSVTGNHVHGMLRDLAFDWTNPMHDHHRHDHVLPRNRICCINREAGRLVP